MEMESLQHSSGVRRKYFHLLELIVILVGGRTGQGKQNSTNQEIQVNTVNISQV